MRHQSLDLQLQCHHHGSLSHLSQSHDCTGYASGGAPNSDPFIGVKRVRGVLKNRSIEGERGERREEKEGVYVPRLFIILLLLF